MERLTKRSANGRAYFPYCFSKNCVCVDLDTCDKACVFMERVCEKLAEYEDKDEQEK